MAPITRTCSVLALALLGAGAASASSRVELANSSTAATFVGARAAELNGDPRRAAILYASLAAANPSDRTVADRAIGQAISAGDTALALRLISARRNADLAVDAQLLLAADRLAEGKTRDALHALRQGGRIGDLAFLVPFVEAWNERRVDRSLQLLAQVPAGSAAYAYLPEHRALLLLRARKMAEAEPFMNAALRAAGGREARLRIALADAYRRAGDSARAQAVLAGRDPALEVARRRLDAGDRPGTGIHTAADAYSELLTALAIDLSRAEVRSLPIAMVQIARVAAPSNPAAPVLLGVLLGEAGRLDDALVVLRSVEDDQPFAAQARDAEVRVLTRAGKLQEALARAQAFASSPRPTAGDWSRLGDVLDELERYDQAAQAYGRALALLDGSAGPEAWQLHLLRGAMLERGDRWPEARASLLEAQRLAPRNPLVLNYLGYAQLERGEKLDEAEALIAQAHQLAPDDASITDSLGWAQFKRGRVEEAIATLQRAARSDPRETEIHEHLGDALYTAGRKFEARHAWRAALVTAEDDVKARLEAKIGSGLNPQNAAP